MTQKNRTSFMNDPLPKNFEWNLKRYVFSEIGNCVKK